LLIIFPLIDDYDQKSKNSTNFKQHNYPNMRIGRIGLLGIIFVLPCCLTKSQIPVGAWRDHLPYSHAKRLAEAGDKIYCATSEGGLFSYDTRDNNIRKNSKVNGLSDADISTIGYSIFNEILFIGYLNGNIDLVKHDSVYNIPDIKSKMIVGNKSINNVYFRDHFAYLACGFGIVLCDLQKREIKDSYFFGPGGTQISVNDITSDGQYLYAATVLGIFRANLNNPNLVDYNAWQWLDYLPYPDKEYRFIAYYNNKLLTVYSDQVSGFDNIISIEPENWEIWPFSFEDKFAYIGVQYGCLVVCSLLRTKVFNEQEQLIRDVGTYYAKHAIYDSKQVLWYANPDEGLMKIDETRGVILIVPDGPAYRDAGDIEIKSGNLWAGAGTIATQWTGYGAYSFIDEDWVSYNRLTIPELSEFLNISEIAIDPLDNQHVIGGSYGYGVAEFQNGNLIDIVDETDGVLQPVPGYGHGYVRVVGADFDQEGNLWIATTFSDQPVYRKKRGGNWETVSLNYKGFGSNTRISDIMATSTGQIWLLIQNDGILVFQYGSDGSKQERFFAIKNQVGDLLDRVYSVEEDLEGDVWLGTNKGPVIFYNTDEIFTEEEITGYQPEIPRNDGSSFVDLLLSTEKINAIVVDGADQKWIATEKSGVFLVSSDGKEEVHHFTEENSPLFSNNVLTVAVNDKTGEVFFGTDKGILSFRGKATEGGDDFANVYVFPNPVRENFEGDITITGLIKDVNVKITDISGNIVYETTSLGGQAIWNGKNFNGERVHTGVYLVFCTNSDGSKTHVTKLLFIH
jgi:hypothetical protein